MLKHEKAVLFLDMVMPGIMGDKIMKALYQNQNYIIVIVSAHADFAYAKEGIRNQVVDYVVKPINKSKIRAALQKIDERICGDRTKKYMFQKKGMMILYRWAGGRIANIDASLKGAYYIRMLLKCPYKRYPVILLSTDMPDYDATIEDKIKAKCRIRNCIDTVLRKIKIESPSISLHLKNAIRVGATGAIYCPEILPEWSL